MDKILAPIKSRILQYIDFHGIEKKYFFEKIGVAASNFRSKSLKSEVGGDVIAKISSFYPDLNIEWLITGKGNMTREVEMMVNEPQSAYGSDEVYKSLLEKKEQELRNCYQEIGRLKEQIERLSKDHPNPKYILGR